MFSVKDHFLYKDGKQVKYKPSPNHSGKMTPRIAVIHYTGDNSLQGALSWLVAPEAQVSAHLVIAKDGTVFQLVPFNTIAWHAGRGEYDGQVNVNSFSIGIENVGIGDEWPDEQVQAISEVLDALYETYDLEDTVGHEDVAPGRKVDPGPNFPWDKLGLTEKG